MGFLYAMYVLSHFIAAQLYTEFCVPLSIYGLLMSPLMTLTPQCQLLRWTIYNSGNQINVMWFLLANFLVSNFDLYSPK